LHEGLDYAISKWTLSYMQAKNSDFLPHQVDWVLAALDLYLDMERNLSDNRFASDPANEIIYTFDEDIFELFVGGKDQEQTDQRRRGFIYTDRRRAVGVFHIKAWRTWRERQHLTPQQEEQRADINRQSAMLTTEWLFSGNLPGRKDSSIYISRQHFGELSSRWETLITNFRPKLPSAASMEHHYIEELEQDHATSAHTSDDTGGTINDYLRATPEPLRSDLSELWKAIGSRKGVELTAAMRSFWQFAFSRKLAATLASLEVTEPISQLLRINSDIAGRLRFLHHVMAPDEPEKIPRSETFGFWKERLDDEIEVRKKRTPTYSRDGHAVDNDAHTMALVQALANTTVRAGIPRRFVLVTADPLLIDAYRAWHCREAEQVEPFVLRPVRHFAPLLNISSMSEGEERGKDEWKEKEDLFPLLREAIEPFLFKLNLATDISQSGHEDSSQSGHEDSVRWYREQYALKLRLALRNYNANPSLPQRDEVLRAEVADQMIFPTALRDLDAVNSKLMEIIEKGRRIERFAIGFGFRWFNQRLAARRELQEAQREFSKGDEAPLARFMQRMLTEFGSTNLDLRVKFASISSDLQAAVNRDKRSRKVSRKVPLVLNLTLNVPGSVESSIASQANRMVKQALSDGETSRRSERRNPLDLDLQNSNVREGGGYRFFALYCCIALALNEWSVAYHCATEAYDRGAKDPRISPLEFIELEYLFAVCIRFRIGAGPIRDAGGADISFERYGQARQLLQDRAKSIVAFVDLRAASELSALILFGSAWSIAEAASPTLHNSFPSALVESEFGECVTLLMNLYDRIEPHIDGRSSFAGSEASQYREVEEQIAVNIAAAYCLTQLGLRSDDTEAFKDYATLFERASRALAWIAEFAKQCRSGGRNCSHIGQFYFSWFEFLRGTSSELRLNNEIDEMNLRIDRIIASRFRRDLLTNS
jgi:hypothetical protein